MGRRKAASKCSISPWLTAKTSGGDGRFIQVGNSLLLAKAFQELGAGAQVLYLCMTMEAGGRQSFTFTRKTAEKYGIGNSTLRPNVQKLVDAGFLTKQTPKNVGGIREATVYSFSTNWKKASWKGTPVP